MQENSFTRNCTRVLHLVVTASRFTSSRSIDDGWYLTSCATRIISEIMTENDWCFSKLDCRSSHS